MRGDISLDFAVGSALFIFAFAAAFSYINYEYSSSMGHESDELSKLKIGQVVENLPWQAVEKRIVYLEGNSQNEFVDLSGYKIDLILDERGEPACFDKDLEGFTADVSGTRIFYLYSFSNGSKVDPDLCRPKIIALSDNIKEKISSPIYLNALTNMPEINSSGKYCEKIPVTYFSGKEIEEKYLDICV
jgi:hypothetical protein